ncbi:MAG: FKBP-type peptidyl-prolyl cis-trans isomerase [Flavobacteriales bacterium]|nr:FKBP-type peptidyl-prolyl cis-trans isomerase [Flavobacteriales bacterium]
MDKLSYSLGVSVGQNVKKQGLIEINGDAVAQALEDVMAGQTTLVSAAEAQQNLQAYFSGLRENKDAGAKQASLDFLAANVNKEGITVTESGLQYEIMVEGDGPKPSATDKVKVHYHGTTPDGTVFDSSVDRGEPTVLALNQVIRGWTEALLLMPTGSKWRLFIPQELAYGASPRPGGPIKPYMALVFEVELISIEAAE